MSAVDAYGNVESIQRREAIADKNGGPSGWGGGGGGWGGAPPAFPVPVPAPAPAPAPQPVVVPVPVNQPQPGQPGYNAQGQVIGGQPVFWNSARSLSSGSLLVVVGGSLFASAFCLL
jgi:hypothetical protein